MAKERAKQPTNYWCTKCGRHADFFDRDGKPYCAKCFRERIKV